MEKIVYNLLQNAQSLEHLKKYGFSAKEARTIYEFRNIVNKIVSQIPSNEPMKSAEKVFQTFKFMSLLDHEETKILYLSISLHILWIDTFTGDSTQCIVDTRKIAKNALARNAKAVIMVHNHPAGTLEPSSEDIMLTKAVYSMLKNFRIDLLDSIIIGHEDFTSLNERKLF